MSKDYYNNKPRHQKYIRSWKLRNKYGIDLDQYDSMLEAQNNKCAICESHVATRNLDVDHDHYTGKVRGLLCSNCNRGLGYFKDDPKLLGHAIKYLKEHNKDEQVY